MTVKSLYQRKRLVFAMLLLGIQLFTQALSAQMRHIFLDTSDSTNQIKKLSFFSGSQGFVAFQDWIGYSADSGKTFTEKPITNSNVNYNGYSVNLTFGFEILGVKAFDQNTVICFGDYGLVPAILYSTDGGNTFTLVFQSQYNPNQLSTGITDMVFPQNDNIGFAVDADRILKSTDKGLTWSVISTNPGSFFDYLEAVDDNHVYAFSLGSHTNKVLATTNSGSSWQQVVMPSGSLNYLSFVSASNGWVNLKDNNGNGNTYYTSNGGATWTQKNNSLVTPFSCGKMKFINDSVGYATSYIFQIYKTMDSGKVWELLPRDNSFIYLGYSFNDLQYMTNNQLWAGGGHGFLELGTAGGGTPLPQAFFLIDTTGLAVSGTVHLSNYSRPNYIYKWLRNDTLFSTAYNAAYTHSPNRLTDTITLIVSNGSQTDTTVRYQSFYPPVFIASFSPTAGAQGTVITINGSHFTATTSVNFGGVPASGFVVVNDGIIQATVGAGASGNIVVGTSTGSAQAAGFVFVLPPTLSSFSPQSGVAGTTVTILGMYLTGTTQVSFGSIPATSFTVVSDGEIVAIPASGSTGDVVVMNAGGQATLPGWVELPVISAISPTTAATGAQVIITGTGFTSVSGINFGGVPARSYVVNSPSSITAIVGAGATGTVAVTTAAGSVSLAGFTFVQGPGSLVFSPVSGAAGTTITITGSDFSPTASANTVYFGSAKATVVSATATSLTVKVPTAATYSPISVTTNGLTSWSSRSFLLTFPGGGSITPHSFAPDQDYQFSLPNNQDDPESFVVGDVDGDGRPDILQSAGIDFGVNIARNTGSPGTISYDLQAQYLPAYIFSRIALADIDGDGILELVSLVNDTVLVFANQSTPGHIVFGPPVKIPSSGGALNLFIGDVDGDGRPDIFFPAGPTPLLYYFVLLNTSSPGSVSFGNVIATGIPGPNALKMIFRDLNGDGKQDLIASYGPEDSISLYTNNSTVGNVALTFSFSLTVNEPGDVHVEDLDGDGKADIFTNVGINTVSLFRNTSTGSISFAPNVDIPVDSLTAKISVADMDGDGKPDLVVTSNKDTSVYIFKNLSTPGSLSFAHSVTFSAGFRGTATLALELLDLDGDGKPDICDMNELLHLLRNTVTAEPFISGFSPTIGIPGTEVTIRGDNFTGVTAVTIGGVSATFAIESDSVILATVGSGATGDIVATNSFGFAAARGFVFGYPPSIRSVTPLSGPVGTPVTISGSNFSPTASDNVVYFGQMQATVAASTASSLTVIVPIGTTYGPIMVTTGQKTAYYTQPFVQTFPGGSDSFRVQTFVPVFTRPEANVRGQLADIDGDGKLDIVTAGSLQILRNTSISGKVSFDNPVVLAANNSLSVSVGDIDGDGKPDIIAGSGTNSFSFYKNISTPGVIQFSSNQDFPTGNPYGPVGITIADVDGDGKPDVITIYYEYELLSVMRNISSNGQVAFESPASYRLTGYPFDVKAGDLDGDGLLDIAVGMGGITSIFRNTSIPGTISFASEQDYSNTGANSLVIGDMDGDGKPDLTLAYQNANQVTILRNTSIPGSLSFAAAINTSVPGGPMTAMVGDLDGDGKADVASANPINQNPSGPTTVSVVENESVAGTVLMQSPVDYSCASPSYGGIGDIDGDGRPDIAVWGSGGLTVLRNETAAPALSFTPTVAIPGQVVTITGSGFSLANSVRFGNTPASSYQVNSDTTMTAVVGLGSSGSLVIGLPPDSLVLPGFVCLLTPTIRSSNGMTICAGAADTLLSSAGQYNQWYRDGVLLLKDTANFLVVSDSGAYTVAESFAGVTAPSSAAFTVAMVAIPAAPVISQDSLELISSIDSGNQWYMDTTSLIAGAIDKQFIPSSQGYYAVRVTQDGCTSPFSVVYDYIPPPPPVITPVVADTVQVVPNPFTTNIVIRYNQSGTLTVQVTDIRGKQLLVATNLRNGDRVDLAWLTKGYYFVKIRSDDGQLNVVRKVLKL